MGILKQIKLFIKWRNTTYPEMAEIHELIMMAARRCAYDLKHASSELSQHKETPFIDYHEKACHWLDIFCPDGDKQYRHRLHHTIYDLEGSLDKYKEWFKDNKIEDPHPDIPF